MAISTKTIKRIKALADDQRGDPAVRAVAQKKLEELQIIRSIIPSGFYNDVANWTKTTRKYKQTETLTAEVRDSYHLNFYIFQIGIYNANEAAELGRMIAAILPIIFGTYSIHMEIHSRVSRNTQTARTGRMRSVQNTRGKIFLKA